MATAVRINSICYLRLSDWCRSQALHRSPGFRQNFIPGPLPLQDIPEVLAIEHKREA